MADYRFVTAWLLDSPIDPVWDALYAVETWPQWWRGVTRTQELAPGEESGVGKRFEIAWRSFLPYDLVFQTTVTALERPSCMEGRAVGELDGTGRWLLSERAGVTTVVYDWDVRTTRRWMNLLAPVARPVFAWNHDYVMRRGAEGLATRLGTRLLAAS